MDNEAEVSLKFKNSITGEKKLEEYANTLSKIHSLLSGINSGSTKSLTQAATDTKSVNEDVTSINKKVSTAFNYGLITKFASAIKKLGAGFTSLAKQSFDYLENFNLFQVAFNGNYRSAERFINKMSEMYGLDESWLTQTVGKFKQLSNAMNLTTETGEKVSELLTQMSLDISSLYNVDIDRAASTLASAMAGQTKPIRGVAGADITQPTLQTTLDTLGIDTTVNKLSFAEKRLLIIISLTQQLNASIGDMGRTIESPSNQLRIMNEQWERLTRAVGNVFLPILAKILPYLNAILMVLTEIISLIASLVGYKTDDFDYFEKPAASVWDFDDGLKSAGTSAKKLKQGLRGFDKLNNITTPSAGGSGGGVGGGGINPKLLDAFNNAFSDYQNKLKDVEMKATRIRDSIMEWLGFTKQVDEETGKVSFKFDHITGGTVLGALAVGGTIYSGVHVLLKMLGKIGNFTGLSKVFITIGSVLGKITGIGGIIEGVKALFAGVGTFAEVFSVYILPALEKLGGFGIALAGIFRTISGINNLLDDSSKKFDGIIKIVQGIAVVVTGVAVAIAAWPVALGAAIAAVVSFLTQLIVDNWDAIKEFFVGIWDWFSETVVTPIVEWLSGIAGWINETVIQPIVEFFTPIVEAIVMIFNKVVEIIAKIIEINIALGKAFYEYVIKPIAEFVKSVGIWIYDNIISPVVNWIKSAATFIYNNLVKPVANFFKNVGNWVYNNIIKPIVDKITWLKNKAVEIFKLIGTKVSEFISGAIKGVINGIFNRIESAINGFIKLLNGAIGIINKIPGVDITKVKELKLPRLQAGIDFVPNDYFGPVYLDYGERVLTKQENKDYSLNKASENSRYSTQSPQVYNIYLDKDHKVATYTLEQLQDMAKTNGRTITIGG